MMVALTYCLACQHGEHDRCHGGQAAPEGMIGGWRCRCEGECVERAIKSQEPGGVFVRAVSRRPCPYCEGDGCEECDQTGERVRTHIDMGDGSTFSVSGSVPLDAEAVEALKALARAVSPAPRATGGE